MKTLIPLLFFCFLISRCQNDPGQRAMMGFPDNEFDTTSFPVFIDGGTKIVYQVGHLTPEKGLKLYFDTITYPEGGLYIPESIKIQLSFDEGDLEP